MACDDDCSVLPLGADDIAWGMNLANSMVTAALLLACEDSDGADVYGAVRDAAFGVRDDDGMALERWLGTMLLLASRAAGLCHRVAELEGRDALALWQLEIARTS